MKIKPFWIKWVVYVGIGLLPLGVFYWQVPFIGKMSLSNDYVSYPIQNQLDLQFSMKYGSFPLYVPGYGGGQTAAALTQGQMYHPFFYIYSLLPGYWNGDALLWNTLLRLLSLGCVHLLLFILLLRLKIPGFMAFVISFITVYNQRMLDLFRYGSSLENYTGYLLLCAAMAFYYLKPTRAKGPLSIMAATYLLICGGHPQMMYLAAIGMAISALTIPSILNTICPDEKKERPDLKRYFTTVSLSGLAGVLLSAAYIIPFYKDFLLLNSTRVAQNFKWSADFSDTVGGLLNNIFMPLQSDVHGAFGSTSLILLLFLIPFFWIMRKKVPVSVLVLWASSIVILLCSLGKQTPLYYLFWKYFPLASVFRCPPRINVALPFLFLLLLAWLFRDKPEGFKLGHRELHFSAYLWPTLVAIPLFIFYNRVLIKWVPKPGYYHPYAIQRIPEWVAPAIFWLGLMTLFFVGLHAYYPQKGGKIWRGFTGILLVAVVLFQVTIQIRYGSWVDQKHPQPTLEGMAKKKMKNLTAVNSLGDTMESEMVITQRSRSIVERRMALFYQKYMPVADQNNAYHFLATEDVTDKLVVEIPLAIRDTMPTSPMVSQGEDSLQLQESAYNRVAFSVTAAAPGFLALSFPFTEQWHATVDGKKSPIYRANGYMQAVQVAAGEHRVEFRYWSGAALMGMVISGLTFMLIGCYCAYPLAGKKRFLGMGLAVMVPLGIFWGWYASLYSGENLNTIYTWNSTDFPHPGNLAYGKKTDMSSGEYSLNYAGVGVDGNFTKPFKTENRKQEWWQVDLGNPKKIGEIVLFDKSLHGKEQLPLRIYGSLNKKTFTLLKLLTERGTTTPWRVPMKGEMVRYIRFQPPKKTVISFTEIEVYPAL